MPDPAPVASGAKPRGRSIAARRAARIAGFERETLIVDCLNRGLPAAEIAGRIGVTEKRMRALTKEILARRLPAAPEEFVAVQIGRLNEALTIAYGAMSADNLKAVALVVRIVRELDRYHAFVPARRRGLPAETEAAEPAGPEARTNADAGRPPLLRQSRGRRTARAIGPRTAPEPVETIESAPEYGGLATVCGAPTEQAGTAPSAPADELRAEPPAAACGGAHMAPETSENIQSGLENGAPSAALERVERPSAGTASAGLQPQADDWPEHTATVLAPDPAAPGGFRRMRIRFLRNGVAAG